MKKFITHLYRIGSALLVILSVQLLLSCKASNTAKGTAIGAGSGAVIGGVIGHQSGNTAMGAIIGATVGGATGAIIGNNMDKQAAELKADLEGATVERVGEGIKITFDSGLMFDFDSYNLTSGTQENLKSLAKTLNKYDDTDILIEGHTDKTGTDAYNMTLSEDRSEAVKAYLKQRNVSGGRITTKGYGEQQLISENDLENRRVEVAIYANKKMKKAAEKGQL
jgi:outer membrane protein OmpA-like peptidoglycan-associated protein